MLFYLMHKNDQVALMDIDVGYDLFNINDVKKIVNHKLLTFIVRKKYRWQIDAVNNIGTWYRSRYFDIDRYNFYDISNQLSMNYNNRATDIMYAASFYAYGASLLDNYWFNPVETVAIDFGEYMPTLTLSPTIWEKVDFYRREWPNDVGQMFEDSVMMPKQELKAIRHVNLDSPDIALSGRFTKRWVKKEDGLYIKKIFPNTDVGKRLCEQQIKISQYVESVAKEWSVPYIQDDKNDNICYCKNFLRESEDFISPICVLLWNTKRIKKKDAGQVLYENAVNLGCDKKLIREYDEIVKMVEDHFGVRRNLNNLGFIINETENKIIKPAPIYGSFLAKI